MREEVLPDEEENDEEYFNDEKSMNEEKMATRGGLCPGRGAIFDEECSTRS